MNTKSLVLSILTLSNGSLDEAALDAEYLKEKAALRAFFVQDQDTVGAELNNFLLMPKWIGARSMPIETMIEGIFGQRVKDRMAKGEDYPEPEVATAEKDRLETVLRYFITSNPDQFYNGKRGGVAIRYVHGDYVADKNGNPAQNADGTPIQRFRHTDAEWHLLDAKRAASVERKEIKAATKAAEKAAKATLPPPAFIQPIIRRPAADVAPESAPLSSAAECEHASAHSSKGESEVSQDKDPRKEILDISADLAKTLAE